MRPRQTQQVPARRRDGNIVAWIAVILQLSMLGGCLAGCAVIYWFAVQVGLVAGPASAGGSGLGAMALWLLTLLLVAGGHIVASVWAWRTRPSRVRVLVTQVPHAAAFLGAVAWWWGTWTPGYLLWAYATVTAGAWLTVWFLHAPHIARRAVVYLTALGVLVAVNTAGVLGVAWRQTNGFGWRGQSTPWAAFIALTATSCLAKHPFYDNGSNTIPADCPSGPDGEYFAGDYDETGFANNLCGEQPRQAFTKWWQWNRQYQLTFTLDWEQQETTVDGRSMSPPFPEEIDGGSATVRYRMSIEHVSDLGATRPHRMHTEQLEETWTATFAPATVGGWKVCRIDINNPIHATFTELTR